jgi:hypothetical protein
VGVDPFDGGPLRCVPARPSGRLLELAAGAGTVSITRWDLTGTLRPTPSRPAISFRIARDDVECVVVDRPVSTVQLLAPCRFGAITLQVLGGALDRLAHALDLAGYPTPEP